MFTDVVPEIMKWATADYDISRCPAGWNELSYGKIDVCRGLRQITMFDDVSPDFEKSETENGDVVLDFTKLATENTIFVNV